MTDRQRRDDEIIRLRIEQRWTYREIGKHFGLTNERVRRIVDQAQFVDHSPTRAPRLEGPATAAPLTEEEFNAAVGPSIRALLTEGVDPGEIARRLQLLGKQVGAEQVREFAERHRLPIPLAMPALFDNQVLRVAVLAAAAAAAGLEPEPVDAMRLSSIELQQLRRACASIDEVEEAARLASCGRRAGPTLTITKNVYDAWRAAWLVRFPKGVRSPWPVTSQTIRKRLGRGFWNQAVRDAGLASNVRGRSSGLVIYTRDDYEHVMAAFVADAIDAGLHATIGDYERWAAIRAATHPAPSVAAIRDYFSGWPRALQIGQARSGRILPTVRRRLAALEADRLVDQELEGLARLFEEATSQLTEGAPKSKANRRIKEEVAGLTGRLVKDFEFFRRRWLLAAVREDPQGFFDNLGPNGRASKDARRVWGEVNELPLYEVIRAVIDERSLDGLLGDTQGNLRDDGGWLAPSQRARLDRIDPRDSVRWRVLKAARNCIGHHSGMAPQRLKKAIAELDPSVDAPLMIAVPRSTAEVIRWLAAEVEPPRGYPPASRLHRSRLAYLHSTLVHVARAMRSEPPRRQESVNQTEREPAQVVQRGGGEGGTPGT